MNVEIAQRLAELRREKGYSQEELAEKLGLSRQAVSKWERAESSPDTDNLIALARLYGVSLDELLAIEPIIEDDIAFEAQDRALALEEKAAQEESFAQAAQSVQEANNTAAQTAREAAEAASQAARAASEAALVTAQVAQSNVNAQYPPPYPPPPIGQPYPQSPPVAEKPPKHKSALHSFPYPIVIVIIYLVIGFLFNLWHPGWIIFLTIPFYYWIVAIVDRDINRDRSEL